MVSFLWVLSFDEQIKVKDFTDGFHIYLTLKNLKINNILIPSDASNNANLKSLNLRIDELNFLTTYIKIKSSRLILQKILH